MLEVSAERVVIEYDLEVLDGRALVHGQQLLDVRHGEVF